MFENQVFQFKDKIKKALPFGMFLSQWIFTKLMNIIVAHLHQCAVSLFLYLDDLLKRSNSQQICISHNILPLNSSKSRNHSRSKEVRFDTSSAIHLHRDGISDTTQHSQGTSRLHRNLFLTIKLFLTQTQVLTRTFLSLLGKLSAAADFLLGRLHLQTLQMCLLSVWRPYILLFGHKFRSTV